MQPSPATGNWHLINMCGVRWSHLGPLLISDTWFEDPSSKYFSDPDRQFSKCLWHSRILNNLKLYFRFQQWAKCMEDSASHCELALVLSPLPCRLQAAGSRAPDVSSPPPASLRAHFFPVLWGWARVPSTNMSVWTFKLMRSPPCLPSRRHLNVLVKIPCGPWFFVVCVCICKCGTNSRDPRSHTETLLCVGWRSDITRSPSEIPSLKNTFFTPGGLCLWLERASYFEVRRLAPASLHPSLLV